MIAGLTILKLTHYLFSTLKKFFLILFILKFSFTKDQANKANESLGQELDDLRKRFDATYPEQTKQDEKKMTEKPFLA